MEGRKVKKKKKTKKKKKLFSPILNRLALRSFSLIHFACNHEMYVILHGWVSIPPGTPIIPRYMVWPTTPKIAESSTK